MKIDIKKSAKGKWRCLLSQLNIYWNVKVKCKKNHFLEFILIVLFRKEKYRSWCYILLLKATLCIRLYSLLNFVLFFAITLMAHNKSFARSAAAANYLSHCRFSRLSSSCIYTFRRANISLLCNVVAYFT